MTRMLRGAGLVAVGLGLLLNAACTPDETGYGDSGLEEGGDLGTGGNEDPALGDDEADGGGRGDSVYYAPSGVLGSMPIDVTVIAPTGTFSSDALTVTVQGGADADPLAVVDGGFVGTVVGSADDIVEVRDDGAVVATVTLQEGTGTSAPGSVPDTDDADGMDGVAFESATGGALPVGDGSLSVDPPYLAYNQNSGASVYVAVGDDEVTLPVSSGDIVCVAAVATGNGLDAPWCAEVP